MKDKLIQELLKPYLNLSVLTVGNINNANMQMINVFNSLIQQGLITIKDDKPEEPKKLEK